MQELFGLLLFTLDYMSINTLIHILIYIIVSIPVGQV